MLEWADAEETVETLRRKTAEHFHGISAILCQQKYAEIIITTLCINSFVLCFLFSILVAAKKQRKAEVLEGILETMETDGIQED